MAYTGIDDSSSAFQCKTYTGNGSTNNITLDGNSNLQPNWVWIKDTGQSGYNHNSYDSVRGATKLLWPNLNNAESTYSNSLTSFNSNGFTLGSDSSNGEANGNSNSYVSWNWKESADAGFDIISYTGNGSSGRTISHNLSAVPSMIITKDRGNSEHWACYHKSLPAGYNIYLNLTNAQDDNNTVYTTTAPTSSVYSVGNNNRTNGNGRNYISYVFAGKQGYSNFGSYTGNGSTNGTFVYTGFKPAFVLCKLISGAGYGWTLFDNKRIGFNELNYTLQPDGNAAQNTGGGNGRIDILSNGFKLRTTDAGINGSGSTYIFMAFAENPFTTSTGVAGLAR